MSEIVVIASLKAQEGKEDAARDALLKLVEATHADPGCLLYTLHQGQEDRTRLAFVERWDSRENLDSHMASDHIAAAFAEVGDMLTEPPEIVQYDAVAGGDPAKGTIAAAMG